MPHLCGEMHLQHGPQAKIGKDKFSSGDANPGDLASRREMG